MSKIRKITPAEAQTIGFVILGIAGVVVLYGVLKFGAKAVDKTADLVGAGSKGKKADDKVKEINSQKLYLNPFSPSYLTNVIQKNPGKVIYLLTEKGKVFLYDYIKGKLSAWNTYKHPLSFNQSRKEVVQMLKENIKHKTQLSDLATYFYKKGENLLEALDNGYRDRSILSGAEYQEMLTDLLTYLQNLPQ